MYKLITRLFGPLDNLVARHFELHVLPRQTALVLRGYAMLREYSQIDGEDRYEGGESRQVKAALESLVKDDGNIIVQVRLTPALERQRETTYPFVLTQNFQDERAMQLEVDALRGEGIISEHIYPLRTPTHEGEEL